MGNRPIVKKLTLKLDEWKELEDGSLWFCIYDQGPPHGRIKGQVLISRTVPPDKWHWEKECVVCEDNEDLTECHCGLIMCKKCRDSYGDDCPGHGS